MQKKLKKLKKIQYKNAVLFFLLTKELQMITNLSNVLNFKNKILKILIKKDKKNEKWQKI